MGYPATPHPGSLGLAGHRLAAPCPSDAHAQRHRLSQRAARLRLSWPVCTLLRRSPAVPGAQKRGTFVEHPLNQKKCASYCASLITWGLGGRCPYFFYPTPPSQARSPASAPRPVQSATWWAFFCFGGFPSERKFPVFLGGARKKIEHAPLKTAGLLPPKRENCFKWRPIAHGGISLVFMPGGRHEKLD